MINLKLTDIAAGKGKANALSQGYLYKDVLLDIEKGYTYNKQINSRVELNDIRAIYDLESVKNSIATCFLTSPGQKLLSPTYGIDLRRYLFESINQDTAFFIRRDIEENLPIFEPRVIVRDVIVIPDEDNNQYEIYLEIDVPPLNIYNVSIKNRLTSDGYYII